MGLIAVSLIFCIGLGIAQACSSAPMHPEVLYCRADFVIKVFVRSERQVYVQEDGTFIAAETPERKPSTIPEDKDGDNDPDPSEPEEIPPALFPPEPIISNEISIGAGGALDNQENPLSSESNAEIRDAAGLEFTDTSNEQPEENEEAGPAPEGGRVINWHGIRTSHSSQNKVVPSPINLPLPVSKKSPVENTPALIVNDNVGVQGPDGANDGDTDQESNREAAARSGRYIAMSFAAAARTNYAQLGPNGAIPGNNNHFRGIQGRSHGLRIKRGIPKESRRIRKRKRNSLKRAQRRHSHPRFNSDAPPGGLLVPDTALTRSSSPTGVLMRQYSITILKVLKGEVENDTQYIYTPPHGGLCMMNLNLKHPYIVMGTFRNDRLHINQGDYKIDVSELSSSELRHLTSNMKHRYSRGCKDCYIKVCNPRCNDTPDTNQCVWKNPYSLMDAKASQFACVRKKKGVCDWYNALKPQMTQDDLDRSSTLNVS